MNRLTKEIEALIQKAKAGDGESQFDLANRYASGAGVVENQMKAVKWYRKASEQGHAGAQYKFGLCNSYGTGVPRNEGKAEYWYRKAAEQGEVAAQYALGCCYADGAGVAKDEKEAARWYSMAAELGHAAARKALKREKRRKALKLLCKLGIHDLENRCTCSRCYKTFPHIYDSVSHRCIRCGEIDGVFVRMFNKQQQEIAEYVRKNSRASACLSMAPPR